MLIKESIEHLIWLNTKSVKKIKKISSFCVLYFFKSVWCLNDKKMFMYTHTYLDFFKVHF